MRKPQDMRDVRMLGRIGDEAQQEPMHVSK